MLSRRMATAWLPLNDADFFGGVAALPLLQALPSLAATPSILVYTGPSADAAADGLSA